MFNSNWITLWIFPLTNKRTSGVIFPSFGQQNDRGYFLQNGGYYFALNDYVDLAVLEITIQMEVTDLELKATMLWDINLEGISFRYENLINSERGFLITLKYNL